MTGRPGDRTLPAAYVRENVELAYATTVHGVQGDTAQAGHLVVGDHTSAQAAYVGMTRGRRGEHRPPRRAGPGPGAGPVDRRVRPAPGPTSDPPPPRSGRQAEAAGYAPQRPLDEVCGDLWDAWTRQADCQAIITREHRLRQRVTTAIQITRERDRALQPLLDAYLDAHHQVAAAKDHLQDIDTAIATRTEQATAELHAAWQAAAARSAAGG